MAEADAEDRRAVLAGCLPDKLLERLDRRAERRRVPRAVREEDAVGPVFEDLLARAGAGDDRHGATALDQEPRDIPLHAEVDRHDMRGRAGRPLADLGGAEDFGRMALEAGVPASDLRGHHVPGQVAADEPGAPSGLLDERGVIEIGRRDDPLHRADFPGPADEASRVDPLDPKDPVTLQVARQVFERAEVAGPPA